MSRFAKSLAVAGLAVLLLLAAAYVFRDALATRVFASVVDGLAAVQCDHANVRVSASLREIRLSPLDCTVTGKPMKRLRTRDDAVITLRGFGVEHIRVARAVIDYKDRDLSRVESNTLGDVAAAVGVTDKLVKSLLDASESYATSAPPIEIALVTLNRAGSPPATMHGFVKSNDGIWERTYAARLDSGPVQIRPFDMRVTSSKGRLDADVFIGTADRGEKPDLPLRLDGTQLDSERPQVKLHVR